MENNNGENETENDILQIERPKKKARDPSYNGATVQSLLKQVTGWNWNLFEFAEACPGKKPLFILAWHLFEINGLFEEYAIPLDKFNNFMWKIQEGYRELPCKLDTTLWF